ncbi:MAG TPA: hypothetical protein PKA06_15065, partial [Gemmatales bacterium]|nr:hypothetical protein [Gemmatales bacterium]
SIKEALELAGPGDTIRIMDQQNYEEVIHINPKTIKNGYGRISIVADISAEGKRARLMPPPSHPAAQPLMVIDSVENVTLQGLLLDGADGVQIALELRGSCPSLRLDNIRIDGFQQSGMVGDNLKGSIRKEIYFEKLHIKNSNPQPAAHGIRFQGSSCENIMLKSSRIQGLYQEAISLASPTQRFQMEQCKLFGGKGKAIVWSETIPANSRMNATIQQCTFWDFDKGLLIETPMNANDIYFTLRNNLFYQVRTVLHVDPNKAKMKPETLHGGLGGLGNVFDTAGSQPGHGQAIPKFGLKGIDFVLNTSPTPAQDFLRYSAASPVSTAGERRDPVGAID